ncbi:GNAT family N-acetyltransferase [Prauserella muralis]|uniref:Acetyltransferase n=1 Tax=Prauserella muralis TaxID=588067 RepID=A0A2V4APG4_9PSEU|nr:GNAT family N-acetyltransferase [Prauserella muralis]PXY22239.1 acetyltransferase [Prauserella muralis]TWE27872.1 hypothetical protein FHX69_0521 [Prauserella muralis]
MTDETGQARVVRNEELARYELWVGDAVAGFSEYADSDGRTVFRHTEIDDAFAGQGLGKVLAAGALDEAVGRGRVIVPVCPFIGSYVRKNPGYTEHVRWPEGTAGE